MSDAAAMAGVSGLIQGVNPETQVVLITNVGDETFKSKYANVPYVIQPGEQQFVPFLAMCLWMGHPDAVDIDKKRRYRHDEFTRLRVRYGSYDDLEAWDEMKPKLQASTPTGERLITVVDDYEGNHLKPETSTVTEKAQMLKSMAAMQEQMAAMQRKMEMMERGEKALDDSDLTTDEKVAAPEQKPDEGGEVTVDRPKRVVVS